MIDLAFLAANVPKIPARRLVPAAGRARRCSSRWRRGGADADLVAERIHRGERPIAEVLDEATTSKRVAGTAVFMFKDLGKAPPALVNNLRHNKVLHKTTLIVSVETDEVPRVPVGRASRGHQGRARRVPGAAALRLHGGARRARGARRDQRSRARVRPRRRHLLHRPRVDRRRQGAGDASAAPSSCSCCSTAVPTAPAASSTCRPTRSSKSARRSRSDRRRFVAGNRLRLSRDEVAVSLVRTG